MSRDQRPGRVRVVSQARSTQTPRRRVGDVDPAASAKAAAGRQDDAAEARLAQAGAKGFPLVALALLFVIGCGAGGALIAALGLFEVRPA